MRLKPFWIFLFWKMWENMEKRPFFRAATAGLGTYRLGSKGLRYRILKLLDCKAMYPDTSGVSI